jgi:DNA-binding transcriptional LysR family regulator
VRLAVGLIPTVAAVDLAGVLKDFRQRYPSVRINLRVGASEDLVEQVSLRRLSREVFVDLPAKTAGRIQSDQAFEAAGLTRDVAFEVTTAYLIYPGWSKRGLAVAMLPSAYAPQLTGVTTIQVTDAPARVEYVIWSRYDRVLAGCAVLTRRLNGR